MSKLLLLDSASMYFRAYFGVPDTMRAPDGTPVNAVRGFMNVIARLIEDREATHLAACWDDDWRPAWRVAAIPTYKTHRVVEETPRAPDVEEVPDPLQEQVPIIIGVLAALGLLRVGHPEMEADDVIGTLATGAGMPVDVVTGDRDLFQVVDDDAEVRVLYPAPKGAFLEVDNTWIETKYGVRADQYADFATMRGDASDGLPGVPGVGEKTAAALLAEFGGLEGIVAAANDASSPMKPGPRKKILAASEYLSVAPDVVAVRRNLDLGELDLRIPTTPIDPDGLSLLTDRWGLGTSTDRLVAAMAARG